MSRVLLTPRYASIDKQRQPSTPVPSEFVQTCAAVSDRDAPQKEQLETCAFSEDTDNMPTGKAHSELAPLRSLTEISVEDDVALESARGNCHDNTILERKEEEVVIITRCHKTNVATLLSQIPRPLSARKAAAVTETFEVYKEYSQELTGTTGDAFQEKALSDLEDEFEEKRAAAVAVMSVLDKKASGVATRIAKHNSKDAFTAIDTSKMELLVEIAELKLLNAALESATKREEEANARIAILEAQLHEKESEVVNKVRSADAMIKHLRKQKQNDIRIDMEEVGYKSKPPAVAPPLFGCCCSAVCFEPEDSHDSSWISKWQ